MRIRLVLAVAVAVLAAVTLAACTPAHRGQLGLSLDRAGNLTIHYAGCGDYGDVRVTVGYSATDTKPGPDGTTVYGDTQHFTYVADVTVPEVRGRYFTVPLGAPASGWQVAVRPRPLDRLHNYTVEVRPSRKVSGEYRDVSAAVSLRDLEPLQPQFDRGLVAAKSVTEPRRFEAVDRAELERRGDATCPPSLW
jgi:hypothetical protein